MHAVYTKFFLVRLLCTEICYHTFLKKIRETNVFTKESTKETIWWNFFWVTVNFSFFHTGEMALTQEKCPGFS